MTELFAAAPRPVKTCEIPDHESTDMSTDTAPRTTRKRPVLAIMPAWLTAVIDVVIVLFFAANGRSAHGGVQGVSDVLRVAWPFLVALVVAWMIVGGISRAAPRTLAMGGIVWIVTVAGGVLVRGASGAGTAFTFILVTAGFLALTLIGWRVVATLIKH